MTLDMPVILFMAAFTVIAIVVASAFLSRKSAVKNSKQKEEKAPPHAGCKDLQSRSNLTEETPEMKQDSFPPAPVIEEIRVVGTVVEGPETKPLKVKISSSL